MTVRILRKLSYNSMKIFHFYRIANISIRIVTFVSKFFLFFALSKLLTPKEVGIFGLCNSAIFYGILILGLDYYTYTQRELIGYNAQKKSMVFQHHGIVIAMEYFLILPFFSLVFLCDLLPVKYIIVLYPILVSEHLSQESNRYLIAIGWPILSSVSLFIRSGLWVWIVIYLIFFNIQLRNLGTVFKIWLPFSLISTIMNIFIIYKSIRFWKWNSINFNWLIKGLKIASFFYVSTILFRSILTVDRFWIRRYTDESLVGAYVFYSGLALTIINLLDPAVFHFLYPKLIECYNAKKFINFLKNIKSMLLYTIFFLTILSIVQILLLPELLQFIDREIYYKYKLFYWFFLLIANLYGISMVPHYGLFASGKEKYILFSHVLSVFMFFIVLIFSDKSNVVYIVPSALVISFLTLLVSKTYYYFVMTYPEIQN